MGEGKAADPVGSSVRGLLDVVDGDHWQRLLNHFSEVIGVTIRTVCPKRELLVIPSCAPESHTDELFDHFRVGVV